MMRCFDISTPLRDAGDEHEWASTLKSLLVRLGFDHFLFAVLAPGTVSVGNLYLRSTFPSHWQDYFSRQWVAGSDCVVGHCRARVVPLAWTPEAFLAQGNQGIYASAAIDGLCSGVVLPVHGPQAAMGMLVVVSSHTVSARTVGDTLRLLPMLSMLRDGVIESGQRFFAACARMDLPILTTRERDCLQWLLAGKSSRDIAQILEIAEATVNFHIANVCKKLGTASRLVAAVRAVRLGLVACD